MKAEELTVTSSPVVQARKKTGLSQSHSTASVGVSVLTLLAIAGANPKAMLALAGK